MHDFIKIFQFKFVRHMLNERMHNGISQLEGDQNLQDTTYTFCYGFENEPPKHVIFSLSLIIHYDLFLTVNLDHL